MKLTSCYRKPILLISLYCLMGAICQATFADKPSLILAKVYREGLAVDEYWISEKLDGVRAYWNGSVLISRQGNRFFAPDWFTAGFPEQPMDGELWMGRGSFQKLNGLVRRSQPDEPAWRQVRFMVFDLPSDTGLFTQRLARMRRLIDTTDSPYLDLIEQYRLSNHQELMHRLDQVVKSGAEGLMLHHGASRYKAGRSDDLLKLKPYLDAEARVISHLPGRGKYQGLMGALLVETSDGIRFRLGTGFSDAERAAPPPIGCLISYRYHGVTDAGIPRFPSFLRVRQKE